MQSKDITSKENIEKINEVFKILTPNSGINTNNIKYFCYSGLGLLIHEINIFSKYSEYEDLASNFLNSINNIHEKYNSNSPYDKEIYKLFLSIYKYFYYSEIIIRNTHEKFSVALAFINYAKENLNTFDAPLREAIIRFSVDSPITVARSLLHSDNAELQREFIKEFKTAKEYQEKWKKEFSTNLQYVNDLSKNLENFRSAHNFVGLVHGFENIKKQKKIELNKSYLGLEIAGGLMIMIPIFIALFSNIGDKLANSNYSHALAWLIPGLTIELFIVYFFRILLQQFKSIQTQLLQIDLRISLCQFIESYIKYKKDKSLENDEALAKFEAIIFSSIVSDSGSIPSTFEGIEQVASIFKSFSGSKN